jgi:hypothetical protein
MITTRRIRDWLTASPFQPFRIFLTAGSHHEVPHPEFAWVFGGSIFVGQSSGSDGLFDYTVKELSLLHVARIEKIRRARPRKARR